MFRILRFIKSQGGQTAVEYVMMLAVSISLGITFTRKVSGWLLTNENSYIRSSLNYYSALFGRDLKYKFYRFNSGRRR